MSNFAVHIVLLAVRIVIPLATATICKGILLFLRRHGVRPERWVAVMVEVTTRKVADEGWIGWIISGLVGIIFVVIWDAFHIDHVVADWLGPPPGLVAEAPVSFGSDNNWNAAFAKVWSNVNGSFLRPIPMLVEIRLYNSTDKPIIPKSFSVYMANNKNGPWDGACVIDFDDDVGKLVYLPKKMEVEVDRDFIHGVLGYAIVSHSYTAGWVAAQCKGQCGNYINISIKDFADNEYTSIIGGGSADAGLQGLGAVLHLRGPVPSIPAVPISHISIEKACH